MGAGYRSGGVAVKVQAAEGLSVAKTLAAIWLALCTLVGLATMVFATMVTFRDGPLEADWPVLGVGLASTVLPLVGAWFALRRGWWPAAMALGAVPVVLVCYAISQFRIRMF